MSTPAQEPEKSMVSRELKIDNQQIDFMRLIQRSPDRGEGWRSVSGALRTVVTRTAEQHPDLYETEERDGGFFVRLSERGQVLADYV